MKQKNIGNKIIMLWGVGGVGKCILNYIDEFLKFKPENFVMIDKLDYDTLKDYPNVKRFVDMGANYIQADLNKTYDYILSRIPAYSIVMDLTNRTDSLAFIKACKKYNIHYINTSIEDKHEIKDLENNKDRFQMTYQESHNNVNEIKKTYPKNLATMIVEFGMNPGLQNIFVIESLKFLASKQKKKELNELVKNKSWNKLARSLGVETIHCSEIDTTELHEPYDKKKFYSTWSPNALIDEASCLSEFCYGNHEKEMPKDAELLYDNVIRMKEKAKDVFCESYNPLKGGGKFIGCVIPHGENISIASNLADGIDYSPSAYYVYKYCPETFKSFKNLKKEELGGTLKNPCLINNYDNKFYGVDAVGCLLLTKNLGSVWAGSILDNSTDEYNSGTTIQVMSAVLSGVCYMLDNPNKGILFPDQVNDEYIFKKVKPYLGDVYIDYVDYKPKSNQFNDLRRTYKEFAKQYKV